LITDGIEGFAVEPCRSDLLADKIEWALTHRKGLMEMRVRAREKASHFTWELFRRGIVDSVLAFQNSRSAAPEVNAQYV
jgi:glycosyltransferase involved in cell wall biosynthesis